MKNIPSIDIQSPNRAIVKFGEFDLYYSYRTLIAFRHNGTLYCSNNNWSKTTGTFLNKIQPDKTKRIPHNELIEKLNLFIIK